MLNVTVCDAATLLVDVIVAVAGAVVSTLLIVTDLDAVFPALSFTQT